MKVLRILSLIISEILLGVNGSLINVKKCCAQSDRINSNTDECEANIGNVPLNLMNFSDSIFNWVPESKCDKIFTKHKGPNYEISPPSLLTIFSNNKSEINGVYRDYCWDTDSQPGHETIIYICDNFINITKCCPLGKSFKEESGILSCHEDNGNAVASANLFIPGNSNINFQISNETTFLPNQILNRTNFNSSEDSFLRHLKNSFEYCLEILDSKWTAINLIQPKSDKSPVISIFQLIYSLIGSVNTICMILVIFILSKTVKSTKKKYVLLTFVIIFVAEQAALIVSYFVDLREIIVFKNALTILYFCILSSIWIISESSEDDNKIYLISAVLSITTSIEIIFFLICFLIKSVDAICLSFAILVLIYIWPLKLKIYCRSKKSTEFLRILDYLMVVCGFQSLLNFVLHVIIPELPILEYQGIFMCMVYYCVQRYRQNSITKTTFAENGTHGISDNNNSSQQIPMEVLGVPSEEFAENGLH